MAPKLCLIQSDSGASAHHDAEPIPSTDRPSGDFLGLDDIARSMRHDLQRLDSLDGEECLEVLIKYEGSDHVNFGFIDGVFRIRQKDPQTGERVYTEVHQYVRAWLEKCLRSSK